MLRVVDIFFLILPPPPVQNPEYAPKERMNNFKKLCVGQGGYKIDGEDS